jgi:hypothetical protein
MRKRGFPMRYEVTWMYYEINWEEDKQEQTFEAEQFLTLDEALDVYESKKSEIDIEHVRLIAILNEHSNRD